MLTAYFDETGHAEDPTLTYAGMAGLVADSSAWVVFEKKWQDAMEEAGLKEPFHMNEFAHSLGQFASWKGKEAQRKALYGHLMSLILQTKAVPLAAIVRIPDFKGLTATQQKTFVDPYYLTFQAVSRGAAHEGITFSYDNRLEKIAMVYAYQNEFSGTAQKVWLGIKEHYEFGACLGSFTTSTPAERLPLQAADILAYEVFKEFENRINRPNDKMRWGLRRIMSLVQVPPPKIMLFDRKELLRITKESGFPDQSNVEEVEDDQVKSVMADTKRWSVERGGIDWEFKI